MIIQIDTREKSRAIKGIVAEFERQKIEHVSSKMFVGDYCLLEKPLLIIDRKQNLSELAQNATVGHERFKKELQRLDKINGKMYILVQQPFQRLEDIIMQELPYSKYPCDCLYKVLHSWRAKHNIEYVFCDKRNTGKKIIELLKRGE